MNSWSTSCTICFFLTSVNKPCLLKSRFYGTDNWEGGARQLRRLGPRLSGGWRQCSRGRSRGPGHTGYSIITPDIVLWSRGPGRPAAAPSGCRPGQWSAHWCWSLRGARGRHRTNTRSSPSQLRSFTRTLLNSRIFLLSLNLAAMDAK